MAHTEGNLNISFLIKAQCNTHPSFKFHFPIILSFDNLKELIRRKEARLTTNTKKMMIIHFCGNPHHNLVTIFLIMFMCINHYLMAATPVAALGRDIHHNDDDFFIPELSTQDEIVQMAGYGQEKLSTVLITGVLLCKRCVSDAKARHKLDPVQTLSGVAVAATCHNNINKKKPTSVRAVTDKYGEFIIDLPSHLHAIPHLDKECTVKVVKLPKDSACHESAPSLSRKHKSIELSSVGNGIRTYSAGSIMLRGKDSEACKTERVREGEELMSW